MKDTKLFQNDKLKNKKHIIWCGVFIVIALSLWGFIVCSVVNEINITPSIKQSPIQLLMEEKAYQLKLEGYTFDIQPIGAITLWGIITSISQAKSEEGKLFIDICLLWGKNLELYQRNDFQCWHHDGRCHLKVKGSDRELFNIAEFSNSHVLLVNNTIKQQMQSLVVGDQIKLVGKLINIKKANNSKWVKSSFVRLDVGDGACEIILPSSIDVLVKYKKTNNMIYHILFSIVILLLILKLICLRRKFN